MKKLYIGYYTIKNTKGEILKFKYFDSITKRQFFITFDDIYDSIQNDIKNNTIKDIISYEINEYDFVKQTIVNIKD